MSRRTLQEITTNSGSALPKESSDQKSVEVLAYEHWLARGCPVGSPEVDWLQAEEDLKARAEPATRVA
jgi:hypothetical protein